MKYAILLLPTLLEIALIAVPAQTPAASTLTREQRDTEIRRLRAELKSIDTRLDVLELEGHRFLPRGMGR